jgi:phenylpyruvate tautomerase PptA (4-oxalocrotonate tautomerase family)
MSNKIAENLARQSALQTIQEATATWQAKNMMTEFLRQQQVASRIRDLVHAHQASAKAVLDAAGLAANSRLLKQIAESQQAIQQRVSSLMQERERINQSFFGANDQIRRRIAEMAMAPAWMHVQKSFVDTLASPGLQMVIDQPFEVDRNTAAASADLQEVHAAVTEAISAALSRPEQNIQVLLEDLNREINSIKSEATRSFVATYVYPLILAIIFALINPATDFYVKRKLEGNDRALKKEIKEVAAMAAASSSDLTGLRFVSCGHLEVHLNPKAKSPVISHFGFGQTVALIERRGAWSLVIWRAPDASSQIHGWVYSRYLSKFN